MIYKIQQDGMPDILVHVVRSRRKTMAVQVDVDAQVTVRVPQYMSDHAICDEIESKRDWICSKVCEMQQREEDAPHYQYVEGEGHLYQGQDYTLHMVDTTELFGPQIEVSRSSRQLILHVGAVYRKPTAIRKILREWYISQAGKVLLQQVRIYQEQMKVSVRHVTIREQKTRWGSCSSQHNLNFNWKLILAPPEALEYVVIHELCHLKEMNHSAAFWQEVEKWMPDYAVWRRWLKEHGHELKM